MSINTVLGPIKPEQLGRTLTHEHISMDFTHFYRKPPQQLSLLFTDDINLNNVGLVRQYPYSSRYNLLLNDADTRVALHNDLVSFKFYGGGTIVENTTEGLIRDLTMMKILSKDTEVHVVAGTGFYIADLQADNFLHTDKEELYTHMLTEIMDGCLDDPTVKAGFMGELASVWPIKEFEKRVIQAAGEAQEQTGCGVSFHPHRAAAAPAEVLRLYQEAGGRARKAVMSHLDRTLLEDEQLLEFAKQGCYCQFDLFGVEVSYYQLNADIDMPSDGQRIQKIKLLIDEGYTDKITVSHDIHTKHRLIDFGGHGYSHILNNVLPRMKSRGVSQDAIDQIMIRNPAAWLTVDT